MVSPKEFIKRKGPKINRIGKKICVFLSNDSKEFYEKTIAKVSEKLGCECSSFLDFPVGNALERVWHNMVEAGVIIVDLTNFSPSVMFELGATLTYREAQEVILICEEKDRSKSIPFNIGPLNINYYDQASKKTIREFEKKLHDDIESILINYTIEDPIRNVEAKKRMVIALVRIQNRDWLEAQDLFEKMDDIEPNNWKINKEWAKLYRLKGNLQDSREKLNKALSFVKHPIHKSEIYLEDALLYVANKDRGKAETAFNQAEELNKNNKNLYLEWTEFYVQKDEPNEALKIIIKLKDIDNQDEAAKQWFSYLTEKIKNPNYKKTFKEHNKAIRRPNIYPPVSPPLEPREGRSEVKIPHGISWDDFISRFKGKIVEGFIQNINEHGAFVSLNKEITGLMQISRLRWEVKNKLKPRLKIKVRIDNAYIDRRDNKLKVSLRYWYENNR